MVKTIVVKYRRRGDDDSAALVFRPRAGAFTLFTVRAPKWIVYNELH